MAKEEFKTFVRNHPTLIKFVNNKEMSWQSFYEMYDMYGENNEVWEPYLKKSKEAVKNNNSNINFVDYLKNIDLDNLQESINSIQRVLGVVSDLAIKDNNTNEYEAKPLYKHLDD